MAKQLRVAGYTARALEEQRPYGYYGLVMRAEVREVLSTDIDIHGYTPLDSSNDGVWVRFMIGPEKLPGEESFDLLICTTAWMQKRIEAEGPQLGRHALFVDSLDLKIAIEYATLMFEAITGDDWQQVASKLSRLAYWEFEDYREVGH